MKKVYETLKEMTMARGEGGNTSKSKNFSRDGYDSLVVDFFNTPEYEVESYKSKNGEYITEVCTPFAEYRNQIAGILKEKGVDDQECEDFKTNYKFKKSQLSWFYPASSEAQFKYMEYGKKWDYLPKSECILGVTIEQMPESITSFTTPKTKEKGTVKKLAHYKGKIKSKVPKDKKEIIK